jgi:hypothetical protein
MVMLSGFFYRWRADVSFYCRLTHSTNIKPQINKMDVARVGQKTIITHRKSQNNH